MRAIPVEVALELEELHPKVGGRPEQRAIHALASNGPNQTLDEAARALHPQAAAERRSWCSIRLPRGNAPRNLVAKLPNLSDRWLQPSRTRPFGFDVSIVHCVVLPSAPGTARVIQP